MQTLTGHTSPETAYVVADYPYGFKLRCSIRYWMEYNPKHGYRLGSQTTNPKKGNVWNKPKFSTYSAIGAAMFLDASGHVQWRGLGCYDGAQELAGFAKSFPDAVTDLVRGAMLAAAGRHWGRLNGYGPYWTVGGAQVSYGEYDRAEDAEGLALLTEAMPGPVTEYLAKRAERLANVPKVLAATPCSV